jgi:transcriptional regulator GlxA family with amidase domain
MDAGKPRKINVAFTLGKGAQVIDVAGPWEVFQDVSIDNLCPFELYTVAAHKALIPMSGGLQVLPNFAVADAPQPDIIVSPAHNNCDAINSWIRQVSSKTSIVSSVCTGAYNLAEAGLLDGLVVTTYYRSFDSLLEKFPLVKVHRGLRFVDQGKVITAGGLTSCIDMSLYIVQRYFGTQVAENTAQALEYEGSGWRCNNGLKQSVRECRVGPGTLAKPNKSGASGCRSKAEAPLVGV